MRRYWPGMTPEFAAKSASTHGTFDCSHHMHRCMCKMDKQYGIPIIRRVTTRIIELDTSE